MKRYLAFCGSDYDSSGGMKDSIGQFDSIQECNNALSELYGNLDHRYDYYQVYDVIDEKLVIDFHISQLVDNPQPYKTMLPLVDMPSRE